MKHWPVQDAKARFSEMLDNCLSDGPQYVSKRGEVRAVLVPLSEWKRLTERRTRSLKELLLADHPRMAPETERLVIEFRDVPDFD